MENTSVINEIPGAMPDIEDDDKRESLLQTLEDEKASIEDEEENDEFDSSEVNPSQNQRWKILRTVAGFILFLVTLVLGITWFFGIGWFAVKKTENVTRKNTGNTKSEPVSEDEKIRTALRLVAANDKQTNYAASNLLASESSPSSDGKTNDETSIVSGIDNKSTYPSVQLPDRSLASPTTDVPDEKRTDGKDTQTQSNDAPLSRQATMRDIEPLGRSLFFGIAKRSSSINEPKEQSLNPSIRRPGSPNTIRFGSMLPVRLIGSIYTLRNSTGMVRMELTRPVEGEGYKYPAGTVLVGNVRSGESNRAFVTIIGLIDPVTGGLIKCNGDLLGIDGASGIEGRKRNLTGKWTQFFRGLKDTASSVIGSVGSIRGGSTVILSDQIKRGASELSDEISGPVLKSNNQTTFIEVPAGTTGYVLITELSNSSANADATNTRNQEGEIK
ncbi:MAG: hypothetical protein HS105_05415 [Chloracidobacterium sp.]|nr:hypothetical protein [Chloracidobacterium sp.]